MERKNEATHRNFGLRPKPPDLRIMIRPYEPVEPLVVTSQPSPISQDGNSSTAGSRRNSTSTASSSTPSKSPVNSGETSITTNNGTSSSSRTPTPPLPRRKKRNRAKAASTTNSTSPTTTGPGVAGTSPPHGIAELSTLPPNHSFNRATREFWRQGSRAVRRPDGSVEDIDVIHWMMTRKGGINASWPQLKDGQRAIETIGKDTIDLGRIWHKCAEEQEEEKRLEERRLANKRRYRPRSDWAKEKAAKKAAAASVKQSREDMEIAGADGDLQSGNVLEKEEPAAKRQRVDCVDEPCEA
ncbi:hypothetical protein BGZ61DRAFT_584950 [Ilyonectria robusta]|uniref:uncharacterized protein n=1 Tax=Ilyonectria robusta TaxID=1079257 RepID=UPI001E8DFFB0|nr:uncharacterized protein BGZ61DRAFT_584950 [Ilyonectria robusta]KAH8735127.1 hypothetical protein BGZ61DRAFT_584950 [Ilyonectria robusta]